MQATAAPPAPDLEPEAATGRPRTALVALAAVAVLLLAVSAMARLLGPPLAALVTLAMLLAVVGAGVALRAGRPGLADVDAADTSLEPAYPAHLDAAPPVEADEPSDLPGAAYVEPVQRALPEEEAPAESACSGDGRDGAPSARALAHQVRCLETTLAEQDVQLQEALTAVADRVQEARRQEQQRVRLVVSALRDAVAFQPGEVALHRVETALDRIGRAPTVERPLLSDSGGTAPLFAAPRSPQAVVAGAAATGVAEAPAAAVTGHPGDAAAPVATATDATAHEATAGAVADPADRSADAAAVPPAPPAPVKVLPVPAPAMPSTPPRKRRGLRRSLA